MSFSSDIKEAILVKTGKSRCCRRAFADGILSTMTEDGGKLTLLAGSPVLARGIADAVSEAYTGASSVGKTESFLYLVTVSSPAVLRYVYTLGSLPGAPLFQQKCGDCRSAYLRGIFVGCGRVSDPARSYHLEFSCAGRLGRMQTIFSSLGLEFRHTKRNGEELLYSKSSGQIQDFFGMLGENDAYFSLMNARIEREIRNGANRVANCEANNITKAVNAAAGQIEAIAYLEGANLLESLPTELAETARLRLANRDLSLSQLALLSVPPISKPGLSHRLKRLTAIADEHQNRAKEKSEEAKA